MQKNIVGSILITLAILMVLMPAVNATVQRYWWDNVYFIEGRDDQHDIKFPHPDRDYYDISVFSDWETEGDYLHHFQINQAKSRVIKGAIVAIGAFMGAIVGAKLSGTVVGAIVGFAVGTALGLVLSYVADVYLMDEADCIWWWLSEYFIDWVIANQVDLFVLCITNPTQAQTVIMNAFFSVGYLRAGCVTFYDAVGVGNPSPRPPQHTLSISVSYGGTTDPVAGTYTYDFGEVVTVTATADTHYFFSYWILDGVNCGSELTITVTMDSDHTLYAQFTGGGGGGYPYHPKGDHPQGD